jgi:hypothetical protein
MRHLKLYEEFTNLGTHKRNSNLTRVRNEIAKSYFKLGDIQNKEGVVIGEYEGVKVRVINRGLVSVDHPEWNIYLGSHHWGKKTDYIPEDEIWIVQNPEFDLARVKKLLNHEIIERQMMRALQDDRNMDPQTSWEEAHYYLKQMGF